MLGHRVTKKYGEDGLPEDTICLDLHGTAGQSFGAFLPKGISLRLQGEANDYLGKGLSGGKIIISASKIASEKYQTTENVIAGNTILYGATAGKVFLNGVAGERFAVRNSGALAVVEGVGEHACEYMTGGTVVILGKVGRNFCAGMSGGLIYVYDKTTTLQQNCNSAAIDLIPLTAKIPAKELWKLLEEHYLETQSKIAKQILTNKNAALKFFSMVVPKTQTLYAKKKIMHRSCIGRLRIGKMSRNF